MSAEFLRAGTIEELNPDCRADQAAIGKAGNRRVRTVMVELAWA